MACSNSSGSNRRRVDEARQRECRLRSRRVRRQRRSRRWDRSRLRAKAVSAMRACFRRRDRDAATRWIGAGVECGGIGAARRRRRRELRECPHQARRRGARRRLCVARRRFRGRARCAPLRWRVRRALPSSARAPAASAALARVRAASSAMSAGAASASGRTSIAMPLRPCGSIKRAAASSASSAAALGAPAMPRRAPAASRVCARASALSSSRGFAGPLDQRCGDRKLHPVGKCGADKRADRTRPCLRRRSAPVRRPGAGVRPRRQGVVLMRLMAAQMDGPLRRFDHQPGFERRFAPSLGPTPPARPDLRRRRSRRGQNPGPSEPPCARRRNYPLEGPEINI